jgi:hypothetical protein
MILEASFSEMTVCRDCQSFGNNSRLKEYARNEIKKFGKPVTKMVLLWKTFENVNQQKEFYQVDHILSTTALFRLRYPLKLKCLSSTINLPINSTQKTGYEIPFFFVICLSNLLRVKSTMVLNSATLNQVLYPKLLCEN